MCVFLDFRRCGGIRFTFKFYTFVQGIVAIIKVLQIVIYRIFRIGICRPACRDLRWLCDRCCKIVIPTREGVTCSRCFGFGCKIVFFDYLFFYARSAVCVKGYFMHGATANGYRKQFYVVANHFQDVESVVAAYQVNGFAVNGRSAVLVVIHNVVCVAFHCHFVYERKFRRSIAYFAVDFRAVDRKRIEQNARFFLQYVTANGAGLRRRCRCRCACRVFFFTFFVTAFAFVPMVGGVARPFFRVFVGELVNRLGFRRRFADRTRKRFYTLFRAGRLGGYFAVIPSMYSRCWDFFVCGILATFSFAGYVFFPTDFRAGRGFCLVCFLIVFKRFYVFGISRRFADRTRKRFYALFRAGWFGGYFAVIPSMYARCRDFFRIAVATGTGIGYQPLFRAGRLSSGRRIFVGMVLVELCIHLHIAG